MLNWLSIILTFVFAIPSSSVIVRVATQPSNTNSLPRPTTNDTYYLPSFYSTLGVYPKEAISYNITLLSANNIDNEKCTIHTNVSGRVVVFTGALPSLQGCNRDNMGRPVALVRTLRHNGALGLIFTAEEKYLEGRVIGFEDYLDIPVLVAPSIVVKYIFDNADIIISIELSPTSEKDVELIRKLSTGFKVWQGINSVLYGILLVIMVITIYVDIESLRKKRRRFSHGVLLKLAAFASSFFSFLWLIVDPFGNNGYLWWYSCFLYYCYQGLFTVTVILVLRIWMQAPAPRIPLLDKKRFLSITSYTLSSVVMLISCANGIVWFIPNFTIVYTSVHQLALALCCIGFVLFGKNFLFIFSRSGNHAPGQKALPMKIAVFIVIYVIITYTTIIISVLNPLGVIFGTMFTSLVGALTLYAIVLILFFPKMEQKHKITKSPTFVKMTVVTRTERCATDDSNHT